MMLQIVQSVLVVLLITLDDYSTTPRCHRENVLYI